ncbi:MAG: Sensor protein BasS [Candidatus Erwinia impunctatus]|nr:Sensor protein BasS [Culicoides impunctatus]
MNSMRWRLLIVLAVILLVCQPISAIWLWHESREQISFLVNETLSARARNAHVEKEIHDAIASLLLPSFVMVCLTLLCSFWAISWVIRPLRTLQKNLAQRSAENLTPLPLTETTTEITAVTLAMNQLFSRLDNTIQQERLFTADAAHELRTPLAGLRLHLELLQKQGVEQSSMLVRRVDQLMHVIEQLLMLSRAGQALAGGHYKRINWALIYHPLEDEILELLAQRQQSMMVKGDLSLSMEGDAVLLRLLLRNLLENASRYSPLNSHIVLSVEKKEKGCQVTVSDEGPGIPDSHLPTITQPFSRGDQRYGGSGLGLNIVQRICLLHQGQLSLHNRTDKTGLNATCWLPESLNQ